MSTYRSPCQLPVVSHTIPGTLLPFAKRLRKLQLFPVFVLPICRSSFSWQWLHVFLEHVLDSKHCTLHNERDFLNHHFTLLASSHSGGLLVPFSSLIKARCLLSHVPPSLHPHHFSLGHVLHGTAQQPAKKTIFLSDCVNGASCSQAGLCLVSSYVVIGTLHSYRAIISVPTRKLDNYREKQQALQSLLLSVGSF